MPADAARRLATLVAALQPLDASDRRLMEPIAAALEVPLNHVIRWLGDLEAAGLVLARRSLRRLVPDALADQLLLDACADPQGRTTAYADELWATFGPRSPANLLANLAELEWRPAVRGTSLLDSIWIDLELRFRAADAWAREQLVEIVIRAAFQAPERALRIVRIALEHPAKPSDWSAVGLSIDDASVRRKLPDLLRRVAEHADPPPRRWRSSGSSRATTTGRPTPRPTTRCACSRNSPTTGGRRRNARRSSILCRTRWRRQTSMTTVICRSPCSVRCSRGRG